MFDRNLSTRRRAALVLAALALAGLALARSQSATLTTTGDDPSLAILTTGERPPRARERPNLPASFAGSATLDAPPDAPLDEPSTSAQTSGAAPSPSDLDAPSPAAAASDLADALAELTATVEAVALGQLAAPEPLARALLRADAVAAFRAARPALTPEQRHTHYQQLRGLLARLDRGEPDHHHETTTHPE